MNRVLEGQTIEYIAKIMSLELGYAKMRASAVKDGRAYKLKDALIEPPSVQGLLNGRTPTQLAMYILGERMQRGGATGFILDGRPAGARDVVRAANASLKDQGKLTIPYPGL